MKQRLLRRTQKLVTLAGKSKNRTPGNDLQGFDFFIIKVR